jgi:hypothetical protein
MGMEAELGGQDIFLSNPSTAFVMIRLERGEGLLTRSVFILIILATSLVALQSGLSMGSAQCFGQPVGYFVEADSGGWYSLSGISSDLSITNHTRVSLTGTFIPTDPKAYNNPDPNFRGIVYVNQYTVNGATYTYAITALQVNDTVTYTTIVTQNGPPPGTVIEDAYGGSLTATTINLTGWLDYSPSSCVTPLGSNQPSALTTLGSFTSSTASGTPLTIPQQNAASNNLVMYGMIGGLFVFVLIILGAALFLMRRRK